MKKKRRIEMIAIHEAAHAVMSFHCRVSFNYVSIIPDEHRLGSVKHPNDHFGKNFNPAYDMTPVIQNRLERHIQIFWAGQIAEMIFFGKKGALAGRKRWAGDNQRIVDCARYVVGGGKVLQKYVDYLYASAERWFSDPSNRYAIRVLADELLIRKKIGSKKAREIIKKAFDDFFKKRKDKVFKEKWKWLSL